MIPSANVSRTQAAFDPTKEVEKCIREIIYHPQSTDAAGGLTSEKLIVTSQIRKNGLVGFRSLLPKIKLRRIEDTFIVIQKNNPLYLPKMIFDKMTDAFMAYKELTLQSIKPQQNLNMTEVRKHMICHQDVIVEGIYLCISMMMVYVNASAKKGTHEKIIEKRLSSEHVAGLFYLELFKRRDTLIYPLLKKRIALLPLINFIGTVMFCLPSFDPEKLRNREPDQFSFRICAYLFELIANKGGIYDANVCRASITTAWGMIRIRPETDLHLDMINVILTDENQTIKGLSNLLAQHERIEVQHPIFGFLSACFAAVHTNPQKTNALRNKLSQLNFFQKFTKLLTHLLQSDRSKVEKYEHYRVYVLPFLLELIGHMLVNNEAQVHACINTNIYNHDPTFPPQTLLHFLMQVVERDTQVMRQPMNVNNQQSTPEIDIIRSLLFAVGCMCYRNERAQHALVSIENGKYLQLLCHLSIAYFNTESLDKKDGEFGPIVLLSFLSISNISLLPSLLNNTSILSLLTQRYENRGRVTSVCNEVGRLFNEKFNVNMIGLQRIAINCMHEMAMSSELMMTEFLKGPIDNMFNMFNKIRKELAVCYPSLYFLKKVQQMPQLVTLEVFSDQQQIIRLQNELIMVLSGRFIYNNGEQAIAINPGMCIGDGDHINNYFNSSIAFQQNIQLAPSCIKGILFRWKYTSLEKYSVSDYLIRVHKVCPTMTSNPMNVDISISEMMIKHMDNNPSVQTARTAYPKLYRKLSDTQLCMTLMLRLISSLLVKYKSFRTFMLEHPHHVESVINTMFCDSVGISSMAAGTVYNIFQDMPNEMANYENVTEALEYMDICVKRKEADRKSLEEARIKQQQQQQNNNNNPAALLASNSVSLSQTNTLKRNRVDLTGTNNNTNDNVEKKQKMMTVQQPPQQPQQQLQQQQLQQQQEYQQQ